MGDTPIPPAVGLPPLCTPRLAMRQPIETAVVATILRPLPCQNGGKEGSMGDTPIPPAVGLPPLCTPLVVGDCG